jgi:hypothetical protein
MFLSRLRRFRLFAVLLAGSLVSSTAVPAALHAQDDDPYCASPLVPKDQTRSLSTATETPEPAHCDVCHWLRSLRTIAAQTGATILRPSDSTVRFAEAPEAPAHSAPRRLVARGPPA